MLVILLTMKITFSYGDKSIQRKISLNMMPAMDRTLLRFFGKCGRPTTTFTGIYPQQFSRTSNVLNEKQRKYNLNLQKQQFLASYFRY